MPGEISRSNRGPKGSTPLVPSWVCLPGAGKPWAGNPDYCQDCLRMISEHALPPNKNGMTGIEVVIVMALLSLASAGMMRTESKVRATNRENSSLRYDRKSVRCEPAGWLWRDMECSEPKLLDWCPEVLPAPKEPRP